MGNEGIPFGMNGRIEESYHTGKPDDLHPEDSKTVTLDNGPGTIYSDESIEENKRRWESEEHCRNSGGGAR